MLDTDTKRRIDTARDILVGKVPDPKSQDESVTMRRQSKQFECTNVKAISQLSKTNLKRPIPH